MADHNFRRDENVTIARAINDHGVCGLESPLLVVALLDGQVQFDARATIGCPMKVTLDAWVQNAVQPAAMTWLGSPVTVIHQLGGYNCRNAMNDPANELSEHAFANAIDISAFELADGRVVSVLNDWSRGTQAEKDFLRATFYMACQYFRTTLGPGYPQHDNHFHLDLAHHNSAGTSTYCRPNPVMPSAPATVYVPVAQAAPAPANASPVALAPARPAAVTTPVVPGDIGIMIDQLLR